MNKKYAYACAGLLLGLTACSNEDLTSPSENQVAGKTVHVTLTVNRPSDNTRTVVDENTDGLSLYSKWAEGDKLLVVNSANENVGELTIDDGIGSSEGVFSGDATLASTETYTLVYLGGSNENGSAYATWTDGTGISNPVATPDSENGFAVSGDKADLCRADLMQKDGVQFLVSGENAYPTDNVSLDAVNAMAHFSLTGIPETLDEDAVLTVNYGEVKHTISNISEQLYLPMPTGNFAISFNLSNGDDTYTASINGGNAVTVTPLYYVTDENGKGKGIEVELEKVGAPDQGQTDDDLVGGVFEVNGKTFRFTKGNLVYNISDDSWRLMDTQYTFLKQGGFLMSDGKWYNKVTEVNEIDFFGYGATGLYDIQSQLYAQVPQYWKNDASQTDVNSGKIYPTSDSKINQGYTGSYLEHGIQFTNFDWGKAYYLYRNNEAKPSFENPYTSYGYADPNNPNPTEPVFRYFTLSTKDWEAIINKYCVVGATIVMDPSNKNKNEYGCLIFPMTADGKSQAWITKNKTSAFNEFLKDKVQSKSITQVYETGASQSYFNSSNIIMTLAQFEALEKLGAVFLPQAYHKASSSISSQREGGYWTTTCGQEHAATIFRFDAVNKVIKLDGQTNRSYGYSVRLVKEVPADYTDPMVVE